MKKTLLFISALVMSAANSFAQDIPNGNFERTIHVSGNQPTETWAFLNTTLTVPDGQGGTITVNVVNQPTRDTSYVNGGKDSSLVLTSTAQSPGVIVSSSANSPGQVYASATQPIGAFAISETPKALQLAYEYRSSAGDTATIGVELLEATSGPTKGLLVGGKEYKITDTTSGWKFLNIPFDMFPGKTSADSARITIVSSGARITAGTVLKVDGLRFLSCIPDAAVKATPNTAPSMTPGFSKASVANGGTYSQVFTSAVPTPAILKDARLPGGQVAIERLDSAQLMHVIFNAADTVKNHGLSVKCGTPNCIVYGGSTGCFTVSGNPDVTDKEIIGYSTVKSFGIASGLAAFSAYGIYDTLEKNTPIPLDSIIITVGTPPSPIIGIEEYLDEDVFSVTQNSPNPFTETTTITFNSPNGGNVTFTVIDVLGQIVTQSVIQSASGTNTYTFDAGETEPGTYFFSLSDGENLITKKFVIGD